MLKLVAGGKTDRGLKRSHNEDSLSVCPDLDVFIVADGMGGHNAGEVASQSAIRSILEFLRHCEMDVESTWPFGVETGRTEFENKLLTAIRLANRDVCNLSLERREYAGMGTTIVAALFERETGKMALAHVGDSRCYRVRDSALDQLTLDHSWVSEQVQKKILTEEEARNHRWKNVITRALGNKMDVDIDVQLAEVALGDTLVLCSDGLSSMVDDQVILQIVQDHPDPDEACDQLVKAANENGGQDNISVVVVRVEAEEEQASCERGD